MSYQFSSFAEFKTTLESNLSQLTNKVVLVIIVS